MEHFCLHGPGDVQGQPVVLTEEYLGFIVDSYALRAKTGRRLYDSAFLSRPKGTDKSGQGGRFSLFEAFGPCRFAGWAKGGEVYEDPWGLGFEYRFTRGEPMGRPVQSPFVRVMATEEDQTGNVFDTVYFNLTDDEALLAQIPGVDPGLTRVYLPGGGEIRPSTASSASKDGGIETFVDFDETHLYNTPELRRMYGTVTRNLRKRKKIAETWYLETTTMFASGEESIAEDTYKLAEAIREGKAKRSKLLFDHRWGECEDLADEPALRAAIVEAYGDAIAWNDLDGLVDGFYDPRNGPEESRRYFLNAPSSAQDAWVTEPEWAARAAPTVIVGERELITLGFDGSRRRSSSVTDATALVACTVLAGHVFEPLEVSVWEQPDGPAGVDWQVPRAEVDRAVNSIFERYAVVGFFADPAKWETHISAWEAKYGARLRVRANRDHPIEWWMTGGRAHQIVQALDEFHTDLIEGIEFTHDGSYALSRHVLNARRRPSRAGLQIAKEHPDSSRKIDAAIAAVLARKARREAVAMGLTRVTAGRVRRLR